MVEDLMTPIITWLNDFCKRLGSNSEEVLKPVDALKSVENIMQSLESACRQFGAELIPSLEMLVMDVTFIFNLTGTIITSNVVKYGESALKKARMKSFSLAKTTILDFFRVMITTVAKSVDLPAVVPTLVIPVLQAINTDYCAAHDLIKDASEINVVTSIVTACRDFLHAELSGIVSGMIGQSLHKLETDATPSTMHAEALVELLDALVKSKFEDILELSSTESDFFLRTMIWFIDQPSREFHCKGHKMLSSLLTAVCGTKEWTKSNSWWNRHFEHLIPLLWPLVDLEKPSADFPERLSLLQIIFEAVDSGRKLTISVPLYDARTTSYPPFNKDSNRIFVVDLWTRHIWSTKTWISLRKNEIRDFVEALFRSKADMDTLRDILSTFLKTNAAPDVPKPQTPFTYLFYPDWQDAPAEIDGEVSEIRNRTWAPQDDRLERRAAFSQLKKNFEDPFILREDMDGVFRVLDIVVTNDDLGKLEKVVGLRLGGKITLADFEKVFAPIRPAWAFLVQCRHRDLNGTGYITVDVATEKIRQKFGAGVVVERMDKVLKSDGVVVGNAVDYKMFLNLLTADLVTSAE
ncbi:Karyopherin transporter [Rhizophlyctis rosea]|nr:Karyopherin transporter [Rhizophlyctis rosea]